MPKNKKVVDTSDSDSGPDDGPVAKKAKTSSSSGPGKKNDSGETYFQLGLRKRVTVREFKGKTYVDIREFYEKDGKQLPGKKGVSLAAGDWSLLKDLVENIDDVLKTMR